MHIPGYSLKNSVKPAIAAIIAILLFFPVSVVKGDWESEANARIEQVRKRDVQITVTDSNEAPISNICVQIKQVRHRFAFGSCVNYGSLSGNSDYRDFFLDHFEWAVCENEMKWASNEGTRDSESYSQADYIANWCADNNIKLRGHCLVWETGGQEPGWVSGLDCESYPSPSEKLEEIDERIKNAVGRYKGQIVQWDIDNEMLSGNTFDCLGEAGRAHFFDLANQTDPGCGMYMNEYSGNSFGGYDGDRYASRAQGLIDLGAPVEGLGIQAHVNSPFQPERYYNNVLKKLAVVGLPIIATEYDTETSSEYQRAEDLENFYRICFSHSSVEGIIMWGFWEDSIWRGEGIANSDWTLNEAGVRYEKLLDEWTTEESIFTDSSGSVDFRGFHGTYEITLTAAGMPAQSYEIELEPGARPVKFVFETNLESTVPIKNINSGRLYAYIQDAIVEADPCDVIIVSPGIYNEDINFLGKSLTLSSVNPDNPELIASTIIKGSETAVTFTSGEDSNSMLVGFTVTGAQTGIYCYEASPTIRKCRIIENSANGIELYWSSNPSIADCEIVCNGSSGIEMLLNSGRYKYYNCHVINNCVIAANRCNGVSGGKPEIANCTIAANYQKGIDSIEPVVENSIVYYNGLDLGLIQIESDSAVVNYSDIQGGWPDGNNIDNDPCFAEVGFWDVNDTPELVDDDSWFAGDYHLMSQAGRWNPASKIWVQDNITSPCIDAGAPNMDWGQEVWPHGKRINMGAYGGTAQASLSSSGIGDIRDLNNDDSITSDDVLLLVDKWNCSDVPLKEDLNLDGIVDSNDLIFFEGNWPENSNNIVPVLDLIEDRYANVGQSLNFSVSAVDSDGDELVYLAAGLPEGATFENQVFSWTPQQAGLYSITFIAGDSKSLNSMTVLIIVED